MFSVLLSLRVVIFSLFLWKAIAKSVYIITNGIRHCKGKNPPAGDRIAEGESVRSGGIVTLLTRKPVDYRHWLCKIYGKYFLPPRKAGAVRFVQKKFGILDRMPIEKKGVVC